MAREHRVPLSNRSLEILGRTRSRTSVTGLVFPNPRGQLFAASTLSHLLKKLGIGARTPWISLQFRWLGG